MSDPIKGLRELDRALSQLQVKDAEKTLGRAMLAAAKVVQAEAKAKVPKKSGLLAKAIRVRQPPKRNRIFDVERWVTVISTKKIPAFYGVFIEYGYQPHTVTAGKGKVLKSGDKAFGKSVDLPAMRPRPFMRPAFDEKKGEAVRVFAEKLAEFIKKATR